MKRFIYKIKEWLSNHKKTKKALFITKVLLDTFVYLFTALIIISLIVGGNNKGSNKTLAQDNVNITEKRAYNKGESYLFTYVDWNSASFINAMVVDLQTNYGSIEHSIAYSPVQIYVSKWSNTQIVTRPDTKGDVDFIDDSQVTLINNVTLNYTGRNVVNNIMYFTWTLDFYRASDNSQMLTWTIMAFPGYMDGITTEWFQLTEGGVPTGLVFASNTTSRFSEYVFLIGDYEATLPYNHVLCHHLQNGNDYGTGYAAGYYYGEQAGYNAGYAAGNATNTDMFTLLEQAFVSVGGILNIQVLPHLTLGVLLFTPLVVLIIIAVFKLIKG